MSAVAEELRSLGWRSTILLLLTFAGVLLCGVNFHARFREMQRPAVATDGVVWAERDARLIADRVDPDGPASRAGIRNGDRLAGISLDGGYGFDQVDRAGDVQIYLEKVGVGNPISYLVERRNAYGDATRAAADLIELQPKSQRFWLGMYMALIGVVYLLIGLYLLLRQGRAQHTRHFYLICLTAFIVHAYSFTQRLDSLDWAVFYADNLALIFLAPLFVHFCAVFPERRAVVEKRPWISALIYVPAVAMMLVEVAIPTIIHPTGANALRLRGLLDAAELTQFSMGFLLGGALLVRTFVGARSPILRQQMKWVVWGLGLSITPFTLYELYKVVSHTHPGWLEALAVGPLILIPLSFGYSIVRYRLMDVDVIMRRSFAHIAATLTVVGAYTLLLVFGADRVREMAPPWATRTINIVGMLVVAMLFTPLKNRIQVAIDRLFYGARYSSRMGLSEFSRTLSATTALAPLLNSISQRLREMLSVEQIVIWREDEKNPEHYTSALVDGMSEPAELADDLAAWIRAAAAGNRVLLVDDQDSNVWRHGEHLEEIHYFVPCFIRQRMIAVIGLGRAAGGDLLSSEDLDLLKALSPYIAVALENSLLYREQAERAEELADLKEFNESIIESINVGILVVDYDGVITTWNSALEELLGVARARALDRSIEEILDADLVRALRDVTGEFGWAVPDQRSIYKFRISGSGREELTVNVSVAPFETRAGQKVGALIVLEDMTQRIRLEQQLQQSEKLSSIGLLAAGVAHEVNTPLTGISSYTQMLLKQLPQRDPRAQLLEKIQAQAKRASDIVSNLLNFSRTGSSEFADLDIHQVLNDTLQLLEPQLRSSRLTLVKEFAEDLYPVRGNAIKLQQVFMNLVLNARDAMPGGGVLTITTSERSGTALIVVNDTGVGIPQEHITRIYDPFFTTKGVGQGTGLGLAVSYGILQEHGGGILVESNLGSGSRFTVKLPVAPAALYPKRRAGGLRVATGD
ncbi:MAG: PAS domain S-box protein [Acidobacteria bacterium]|nr:PAS domain S-box protein [Acidobacteriota bacterium]